MCWMAAWLLRSRAVQLHSSGELEGDAEVSEMDAGSRGIPWADLPEVLLEPISELLGGRQIWHTWRVHTGADAEEFRALRLACSRVARGSASALLRADVAGAMERVKEDGVRERKEARRDFLLRALRVLGDSSRFSSLVAVRVRCWDVDAVKAIGEAFDVDRGDLAVSVDLVLDGAPVPVRQREEAVTGEDDVEGGDATPTESWQLDPAVHCVHSLTVHPSRQICDQTLAGIVSSFPALRELDLRRCCRLETLDSLLPWLDAASPSAPRWLWLDGCWRISDEAMEELAKRHLAGTCHVDLFRNGGAPWSSGRSVEVVILVQQYVGNWVSAALISGPMWQSGSPEPRFNILVHETADYSHAVGFSGRIAFRIRRRHLRERRHLVD